MESRLLGKIYSDIIKGYSVASYLDSPCYLKHLTPEDQGVIDEKYLTLYDKAVQNCFVKEESKIKELLDSGAWVKEDDSWVINQEYYLENLNKTLKNLAYEGQRAQVNKNIEDATRELTEKLNKKKLLIGSTAETWAAGKINEYYIYFSLYKDAKLSERLLSEKEFKDLDDDGLGELIQIYNSKISIIDNNIIKKIALSPAFQNRYSQCDDNIFNFYGKPICELSYYQSEIATYGRYFKDILSKGNLPFGVKDDPDKLMDWHNGAKTAVETAPPADVKQVTENLNNAAAKTGGKLNNMDLFKLFGGNS